MQKYQKDVIINNYFSFTFSKILFQDDDEKYQNLTY
jgi:hypothetical protein